MCCERGLFLHFAHSAGARPLFSRTGHSGRPARRHHQPGVCAALLPERSSHRQARRLQLGNQSLSGNCGRDRRREARRPCGSGSRRTVRSLFAASGPGFSDCHAHEDGSGIAGAGGARGGARRRSEPANQRLGNDGCDRLPLARTSGQRCGCSAPLPV